MESAAFMIAPMMMSYMMTSVAPMALLMNEDFPKERFIRGAAQMAIMGARSAADVTYGDLILDERSGDFSIRDLRIAIPESAGVKDCVIEAASVTIVSLDRPNALAFSTQGDGLSVAPSCGGEEAGVAVALLGPEAFNADHFASTSVYDLGSSTLDSTLVLETAAAGSVSVSAKIEGLHLQQRPGADPIPAGRLTDVSVTVEDIETLRELLPMLGANGDPVKMAAGGLTQALSKDGISDEEQALIDSAQAEIARIMQDGGSITLRSAPGASASFAEIEQTGGPEDMVPLLKPAFSSAIIGPERLVSAERLKLAQSEPGDLDPAQRLDVAKALASGVGAPRSPALAASLLEPLAADGDAEAALAYADLLAETSEDANAAYRYALMAAAGNAKGAWSTLDRIETGLPLESILELQAAMPKQAAVSEPKADVAELRTKARAFATGRGVARDYRLAALFALLASAAGDRASAMLLERLEARFDGEDDAAAWRALQAKQSEQAVALWTGGFADAFAEK